MDEKVLLRQPFAQQFLHYLYFEYIAVISLVQKSDMVEF